ncbi:MAG: SH3 domain-containing protein [Anaerolineales bacterium]
MHRIKFLIIPLIALMTVIWAFSASSLTDVLAQDTSATPTPQPSPSTGMYITVLGDEPFANVRLGPSSSIYPIMGKLLPGDTAPALGRSPGGDWIQIEYSGSPNNKGWVYSPLVVVSPGTLPVMEPPPTPIPPATSTIDPTLAAQFTVYPTTTRLPTFTPAPSYVAPTFQTAARQNDLTSVPRAVVILSLGGFGIFGFILSLLLPRRKI